MTEDKRPDPKPRKHPHLWQSYLWWYELVEMRKRHKLRISSAERGKSNLDAQFEQDVMEKLEIEGAVEMVKKEMVSYGESAGPIWEWITGIKGMGAGGLAAQLIAQVDDIGRFATIAKLWRFAGFAVIDGKAEKNQKGETSKFNRKLKGVCFNIADQFIRQQTPHYVDIYYAEKERQRTKHPEAVCVGCGGPAEKYQKKVKGEAVDAWRCPDRVKGHRIKYSDSHLHNRAWRKMIKEFLKDFWLTWRGFEDLPVSEAYDGD